MRPLEGSNCAFDGGTGIGQILTINCIPLLLEKFIYYSLLFAGVVALVLIIVGGIKLITSSGDSKQVDSGRKIITWAIIGLIVILMSFAVVRFVSAVTGVSCIRQFGFNVCGTSNWRTL